LTADLDFERRSQIPEFAAWPEPVKPLV
jgi:hypothetical protein